MVVENPRLNGILKAPKRVLFYIVDSEATGWLAVQLSGTGEELLLNKNSTENIPVEITKSDSLILLILQTPLDEISSYLQDAIVFL